MPASAMKGSETSAGEIPDPIVLDLAPRSAQLVGEVVQYKDAYRLCYIRRPEGS